MDKPTVLHTMIVVRRVLSALAAVLVGALLVSTAAQAANPVVSAAQRTAAARSTLFDMQMKVRAGGTSLVLAASGAMRGNDSARLFMRMRAGGQSSAMNMVMLREHGRHVIYMRSPVFEKALPAGKTWLRLDLDQVAGKLGFDYSELIETSRTLGPLEHAIESTKRVGTATIAGQPATHYRVAVDLQRAARAVPAFAKQLRAIERTGAHLERLTEDVWIGTDGRIRRVALAIPVVQQGVRATSSITMTFRAFDVPVTVEAPPSSQVYSQPA